MSNQEELCFIKNNLQLSNRMLSSMTGLTINQIKHRLGKENIKRSPEQIEQIMLSNAKDQLGEKNSNWKGGISQDYSHYKRIQKQRYPDRIAARQKAYKAMKSGKLIKGNVCELCGTNKNLQFDHRDYSKPLEVHTVCSRDNNLLKKYSWNELESFYRNLSLESDSFKVKKELYA